MNNGSLRLCVFPIKLKKTLLQCSCYNSSSQAWLQAEAISRFGSPRSGQQSKGITEFVVDALEVFVRRSKRIFVHVWRFLMDDCWCRLRWHSFVRRWGAWHLVRGVLNWWTGSGVMVRTGASTAYWYMLQHHEHRDKFRHHEHKRET